MIAKYKCLKCGHHYEDDPGPTQCKKCNHLYVKWINYEEMYQQYFKEDYERILYHDR